MTNQDYLSIYAKSFNWAGFFLPKQTYKKCSALYSFCRVLDNIADNNNTVEFKENEFKKFENDFNSKNFDNSIIKNMWELIYEFNISLKIIHDLFEGIKSDIKEKIKFNSKKELLVYSYRVAGTVGLLMAKILKVSKKSSLKSAIDLGIAMQLTNISRDVIEDLNNKRSYINENFEEIKST
ncbi:squalene/phytoene synthase family protein, partial [Candidatus Pelagibacter sp.]|nr:squalene/phytoene synthase family protein [Candidatus Pelagibacter sp.]